MIATDDLPCMQEHTTPEVSHVPLLHETPHSHLAAAGQTASLPRHCHATARTCTCPQIGASRLRLSGPNRPHLWQLVIVSSQHAREKAMIDAMRSRSFARWVANTWAAFALTGAKCSVAASSTSPHHPERGPWEWHSSLLGSASLCPRGGTRAFMRMLHMDDEHIVRHMHKVGIVLLLCDDLCEAPRLARVCHARAAGDAQGEPREILELVGMATGSPSFQTPVAQT